MLTSILTDQEVRVFSNVLRALARRFPLVERDDLKQEMFLWCLTHPDKIDKFRDEDRKAHLGKLGTSLRRAGARYAHRETAARLGYKAEDLFFYSVPLIEELLRQHYHPDEWGTGPETDEPKRHKGSPRTLSEGGNRPAMLADLAKALKSLPEADRTILDRCYRDDEDIRYLAEEWGCTHAAARMRRVRIIHKIQKHLGGENPGLGMRLRHPQPWHSTVARSGHEGPGSRRAISNAAALAITMADW